MPRGVGYGKRRFSRGGRKKRFARKKARSVKRARKGVVRLQRIGRRL